MNENTNPVILAHAILRSLDGESGTTTVNALVADLRVLANTVIDQNARVKRVRALAKRMDHEADMIEAEGADGVEEYIDAARSDAYRIRAALKGDDR